MADAASSGKSYYDTTTLNDADAKHSIKHAMSVVKRFRDGKVKRNLVTPEQVATLNGVIDKLNSALDDWCSITKQFPYNPKG